MSNGSIKVGDYVKATCVVCGKKFVAYRASAKYCSAACSDVAARKRKAAGTTGRPSNQPKPDIYCPVRSRFDYLEERTFGAGRKAIDSVQGTSTRTLRRHG